MCVSTVHCSMYNSVCEVVSLVNTVCMPLPAAPGSFRTMTGIDFG